MSSARRAVLRFDASTERAFNHLRGRKLADRAMYTVTELGDFGLIWLLIGAARGVRSPRHQRQFLRLAVCLGVESLLVNQGLKRLFRRVRPEVLEPRPHRLRTPLTTSFPSGHASSAMLAAALLSDDSPRLRPLWYGAAAVVASSRIHVRIHHGSDVVAGAVVGAALGVAAKRLWPLR